MEENVLKLTAKELGDIVNCSEKSIKMWRKGNDSHYRKEGRFYFYEPNEVLSFLIETDKEVYALRLQEWMEENKLTEDDEKPSGTSKNNQTEETFDINVEDLNLFGVKELIAKLLASAAQRLNNVSGSKVSFETNNVTKLADQLRKLELDAIEIDKKLKQVVLISDAKKWIGEVFTKVKTDLRSMGPSIADEIASVTGFDDPNRISNVISEKVNDALRHLSKDIEIKED
jgi:hypothetical protein